MASPRKYVEECNMFDLEVIFTEKSGSLLYTYTSFVSSEKHFYHSPLEQWKPSMIRYTVLRALDMFLMKLGKFLNQHEKKVSNFT